LGGGQRQIVSLYMNNNGTRKVLNSAYANINGASKQIFAPLYGWIRYTYYGSSTSETQPDVSTWSGEGSDYTSELAYLLDESAGLWVSQSYTINTSKKTISLNNYKLLESVGSSSLYYNGTTYHYQYLSSIAPVPLWTLIQSNFEFSDSSVDYSDTSYTQRAYGYRISEITVNPIEIRCNGTIRNGTVRLMQYQSQTKVYSTNKSEYSSSNRTDLGSDFYLNWYSSESGTQYFYKSI